jgi:hypothetical protein
MHVRSDLRFVQTFLLSSLIADRNLLLIKLMILQTVNLLLAGPINIRDYIMVLTLAVPGFSLAPETRYPN